MSINTIFQIFPIRSHILLIHGSILNINSTSITYPLIKLSNAFYMHILCRFKIHRRLFLGVQLALCQHWLRWRPAPGRAFIVPEYICKRWSELLKQGLTISLNFWFIRPLTRQFLTSIYITLTTSWRHKSPATRSFPFTGPLWGESTGDCCIPITEGQ